MTTKQTTTVRIYNEDLDHILLNRGRGTPADFIKKLLLKHQMLKELLNEEQP